MSIGRRFCGRPEIFGVWDAAFASNPAPTFGMHSPVGAGLLAKNDDAVCDQNSSVLESDTCRESPIDTKNRLAAEV